MLVSSGRMDEPEITIGDTATIAIRLETRWADFDRPRIRRYSHADQFAAHVNDYLFLYVDRMESATFTWGTIHGPERPKAPVLVRKVSRLVSDVGDFIGNIFGW